MKLMENAQGAPCLVHHSNPHFLPVFVPMCPASPTSLSNQLNYLPAHPQVDAAQYQNALSTCNGFYLANPPPQQKVGMLGILYPSNI